jgi:CRISPR-associated protein Cas5d
VALSDVDYVIEAHFVITDKSGSSDNVNKFVAMFKRRVAKGQHFHQPYFGCREFAADILPADDYPRPIDESKDLGLMLWDIEFGPKNNLPIFFPARLNQGIMEVPQSRDELFVRMEKGGPS